MLGGAQGFLLGGSGAPEGGYYNSFTHNYLLARFPVLLDLKAELCFIRVFRQYQSHCPLPPQGAALPACGVLPMEVFTVAFLS